MRICHITSVHPPFDTRIFIKECCSAARAGFDVHLVAPGAPNKKVQGVHLYWISKAGGRLGRMTKTVWSVYKKATEINADIYHFHDSELLPVGCLLKLKGKKVICDIHEDLPRQILSKAWIARPLRGILSKFFESLEGVSVRFFDAVITATPFINERFLNLGCSAININNYPIMSELHTTADTWSQKERAVCYVGGISVIRGIYEMVEAIGKTDCQLLLAGNIASNIDREALKSSHGWRNVVELGALGREDVKAVLAQAVAGLVLFHPEPNHINAQPNKMFEYMSAGIPVIASDFSLWREIIEGNKCGICVDPRNIEAISRAIIWLADHPIAAKKMGENGRKAVLEKYNWEAEEGKLLHLYKELSL